MAAAAHIAPDKVSQQETSTQQTDLTSKVPTDPSDVTQQDRDPQKVAQLAYFYWEARGCPDGSAEEDWFRAERELYPDASVREA